MQPRGRLCAAAVAAAGLLACAPAAAHAAVTASVTDDTGAFVPLNPAVRTVTHNISPQLLVHLDTSTGGYYSATAVDQNGSTTGLGIDCYSAGLDGKIYMDFHGDMNYAVTVTTYAAGDYSCARATSTTTYAFAVAGTVAVAQPAGPLPLRDAHGLYMQQALGFHGTPGADGYQVEYARNAAVQPDGSLKSSLANGYVDSTTGQLMLLTVKPGAYTVVVRAKSGDYYTPWSAPVRLKVLAPFTFTDSFPDSTGPRYTVRGKLDDGSARGAKVTLAAARGRRGGHFHTLGHGRIDKHGVFVIHMKIHRRGVYRLRYTFKGAGTVAAGRVIEVVRIRRILV